MRIKQLQLANFRNLDFEIKPNPLLNIILGDNGRGKTNFIDALYLLSHGRTLKSITHDDNILWESELDFAKVAVIFQDQDDEKEIRAVVGRTEKGTCLNYYVNGKRTAAKDIVGKMKSIVFTPETLLVITGSPELRRREIDDFLELTVSDYYPLLFEYKKVVRSRNRILKRLAEQRGNETELEFWTERLVDNARQIFSLRIQYLQELVPYLKDVLNQIKLHDFESMEVKYYTKIDFSTSVDYGWALQQKITNNRGKEILLKRSLYGPHRDDLLFYRNGLELREYGSRGQQRLAVLVFKLAQWFYWREKLDYDGILLIDDIFSELDDDNAGAVLNYLKELPAQIFLTTVSKDNLDEKTHRIVWLDLNS